MEVNHLGNLEELQATVANCNVEKTPGFFIFIISIEEKGTTPCDFRQRHKSLNTRAQNATNTNKRNRVSRLRRQFSYPEKQRAGRIEEGERERTQPVVSRALKRTNGVVHETHDNPPPLM